MRPAHSRTSTLICRACTAIRHSRRWLFANLAYQSQTMSVHETQSDLQVAQMTDVTCMPAVTDLERLYVVASAVDPLNEPPRVARMFATLYQHARELPGVSQCAT